jgi:hypothetical protein
MFAKIALTFSSLFIAMAMLFGQVSGVGASPAYADPTPPPGATELQPDQAAKTGGRLPLFLRQQKARNAGWPFEGDRLVKAGLTIAAAEATSLQPKEIIRALREGKSIEEIVVEQGNSSAEVLTAFDAWVEEALNKAVENDKLPESLAQSRIAWYKQAARMMVDQPRLAPAFPGLHQLHVAIISAAVQVGELERAEVREALKTCKSLNEILAEKGHNGEEAVDLAMEHIGGLMTKLVEKERLTEEQSAEWSNAIRQALTRMVDTGGLHVAGKECTH